jgi:hypothetical protein
MVGGNRKGRVIKGNVNVFRSFAVFATYIDRLRNWIKVQVRKLRKDRKRFRTYGNFANMDAGW